MKKLICLLVLCSLFFSAIPASAGVMIVASTPTYDDSEAMEQNLDRAIEALNDKVIVKGQPFSFNEIVGPRTAENGFAVAPNGNGVSVMGGGVSQVATTLYNALKELGSDLVYEEMYVFGSEYNAGYVENATDAVLTDYGRGLDYLFTSNHAENLAISMWRAGGTVFCQLTGIGTATVAPQAITEPEPTSTPSSEQTPTPTETPSDVPSDMPTYYVVDVSSHVNLRKSPSTSAEVLAQIPKDVAVQFTGEREGDFMKVVYEGKTGYVHSDYLSPDSPNSAALMIVVNCESAVTLRAKASTNAKKLAAIPLGAQVEYLTKTKNGFFKVKYDGKTGFVKSDYLSNPEQN